MIKFIVFMTILFLVVTVFRNRLVSYYDRCYSDKEYEGYAAMGMCGGIYGYGDEGESISDDCIDCPYFIGEYSIKEEEK